ncbi:MAG: ROK family protein [Alphaproteobacteria bacterium]|nr:ROK family protein [Alphaproteobacteria bacterium]
MRIGIDLGGTKIEAIALDDDGAERLRRRAKTPRDNYENVVREIAALVTGAESELHTQVSIGMGMPGSISPKTGLVRNSNLTITNGRPLDQDLSKTLKREVRVENDANCFAVSEAIDGAGEGSRVVFGAILGTGCGGGLAVKGEVIRGANAIGGEWGHNPLPWMQPDEYPGSKCYCGKNGCQETYISGTGFRIDYKARSGQDLRGNEIVELASKGEVTAQTSLNIYADRLARALAALTNILDPDVIVLGGGMSNVKELYTLVPPLMAQYAFSDSLETPLRPAKHGDSSGVRGAAWLWPQVA